MSRTTDSYSQAINEFRRTELCRYSQQVYLDYAGAAPYSEKQLNDIFTALRENVYSNPHSQHSQLQGGGKGVDAYATARKLTLEACNASLKEYDCVFTSGATGGIKLVAEAFPWTAGSCFAYTKDNHTSIVGARAVALQAGARATAVDAEVRTNIAEGLRDWVIKPSGQSMRRRVGLEQSERQQRTHNLFAYPLESNFSGALYDPALATAVQSGQRSTEALSLQCDSAVWNPSDSKRWQGGCGSKESSAIAMMEQSDSQAEISTSGRGEKVAPAQDEQWWVLLDAAKACGTHPPDLSCHKPDFVVLSYYKIFGYPTGLGALLVRKKAAAILEKTYFGGGTVLACSAANDFVRRRDGPAGLEDGTTSFLGVAAIPHGFDLIKRLGGFGAIEAHTQQLTRHLAGELLSLRHFNGQPVCQLYGSHGCRSLEGVLPGTVGQGPTIAFNLLRCDGSFVGYREVERIASLSGIMLRGGCFCNPGACAAHLGLSTEDVQENFEAGHVCWDDTDLINGRPTGAVRVSLGYASTQQDCGALLALVKQHFLEARLPEPGPAAHQAGRSHLASIWVYPIKSCGGCKQMEWPLGPNGLLYDREWALMGEDGQLLTLKRNPSLTRIQPRLDLRAGVMTVEAPNMAQQLTLPLPGASIIPDERSGKEGKGTSQTQIRICAESMCGIQVGISGSGQQSASEWFSQATGQPCTLLLQKQGSRTALSNLSRAGQINNDEAPKIASLGFANEGQTLLACQASLDDLKHRLAVKAASADDNFDMRRFRPNLVVAGTSPFEEDFWDEVAVGDAKYIVTGPCARCEVVCVDASKGQRQGSEPLLTLASYRRVKGRIHFGVLLHNEATSGSLMVGMPLRVALRSAAAHACT